MNLTQGLVPVKSRAVINYSAEGGNTQDQLTLDVTNWTRNQVIELLRYTAASETAKQVQMGNPPDVVIADGTRGKQAQQATRRIEVGFGQRLKPEALTTLKNLLQKAIQRTTQRRTGALSNMGNWKFLLVKDGKSGPVPIGNKMGIPLSKDDAIILRPTSVPHATVANIGGRKSRVAKAAARRAKKGLEKRAKSSAKGFLGTASAQARRSAVFKGFHVAVRFTDYAVRGEKWKAHGTLTGTIMITLAQGKRRGRRR